MRHFMKMRMKMLSRTLVTTRTFSFLANLMGVHLVLLGLASPVILAEDRYYQASRFDQFQELIDQLQHRAFDEDQVVAGARQMINEK